MKRKSGANSPTDWRLYGNRSEHPGPPAVELGHRSRHRPAPRLLSHRGSRFGRRDRRYRDPVTYEYIRRKLIRLRHIERVRIGTPFSGVVDRVGEIVCDPRLQGSSLVVDATGVGAPVVELLRAARLPCRLIPAQITGGSDESSDAI